MYTNWTTIEYFIIRGFSDDPGTQVIVFCLVLIIYLITLCGNMTILLLVCVDPHLHTPMYFFLGNLSIVDLLSSTITLQKVFVSFITHDKNMSYLSCMTQTYILGALIGHELLILTAMSYDRYIAICKPLRYHVIMSTRTCAFLASACWLLGFIQVIPLFRLICRISCYSSIEINHFFCDLTALMTIFCSNPSVLEMLFFLQGLFIVNIILFVLTFAPYIFIMITILKIHSNHGRRKAFYTCSSHLTVVILLYTILVTQYLTPNHDSTLDSKKCFALVNMAAVPMLNPLIYSLKNRDVKLALKRTIGKCQQTT